jgi:hypothetical protein
MYSTYHTVIWKSEWICKHDQNEGWMRSKHDGIKLFSLGLVNDVCFGFVLAAVLLHVYVERCFHLGSAEVHCWSSGGSKALFHCTESKSRTVPCAHGKRHQGCGIFVKVLAMHIRQRLLQYRNWRKVCTSVWVDQDTGSTYVRTYGVR